MSISTADRTSDQQSSNLSGIQPSSRYNKSARKLNHRVRILIWTKDYLVIPVVFFVRVLSITCFLMRYTLFVISSNKTVEAISSLHRLEGCRVCPTVLWSTHISSAVGNVFTHHLRNTSIVHS